MISSLWQQFNYDQNCLAVQISRIPLHASTSQLRLAQSQGDLFWIGGVFSCRTGMALLMLIRTFTALQEGPFPSFNSLGCWAAFLRPTRPELAQL